MSCLRSRRGGMVEGDDGDAVQQVFAESPFPDFFPQIAVGRGHEPEPGSYLPERPPDA